jgi:hypothetical protein
VATLTKPNQTEKEKIKNEKVTEPNRTAKNNRTSRAVAIGGIGGKCRATELLH